MYRDEAFAAAALDAELKSVPQLDIRDRALATELVYGVLRSEQELLRRLSKLAPRGLPKQREVRLHLLIAAYQLLALARVPAFAVVDAAVSQVRHSRASALSGFCNAMLRRMAAADDHPGPEALALQSAPGWLRQRLEATVGVEEAAALLGAGPDGPRAPAAVRLVGEGTLPEWLLAAAPGHDALRTRRVKEGDPRRLEGYVEGRFVVQEEGAQLVGMALGALPGERVLDACAGRGQKSSLLSEQITESGELWATDLFPQKLQLLERDFRRLGLKAPKTAAVDWCLGVGEVAEGFDRVLVDAPCTGVGTLRRRPEILRRLTAEDPARLGALATQILRRASSRARPGGTVIFAVCSVLPEECEAVVAAVSHELEPMAFPASPLAELAQGATSLRLLPRAHGTDGYFMASLRRR